MVHTMIDMMMDMMMDTMLINKWILNMHALNTLHPHILQTIVITIIIYHIIYHLIHPHHHMHHPHHHHSLSSISAFHTSSSSNRAEGSMLLRSPEERGTDSKVGESW